MSVPRPELPLFHFTCDHRVQAIVGGGFLQPYPQPVLGGLPLVWLTNISSARRDWLGLSSTTLDCDRMTWRFKVERTPDVRSWYRYVAEGGHLPQWQVNLLAARRGARPEAWLVSERPVPIIGDPVRRVDPPTR